MGSFLAKCKELLVSFYQNKILFYSTIGIIVAVIITWVSVNRANNFDTLEADKESTADYVEEATKDAKKTMEDEVGHDFPTMEEVDKLLSRVSDEQSYSEVMVKDYGEEYGEVYLGLYENKLLPSSTDSSIERTLKIGQLKYMVSEEDKVAPSNFNLLDSEQTYTYDYGYVPSKTEFEELKEGVYIGYPTISSMSGTEGEDLLEITFNAYSTEDKRLKDFVKDVAGETVKVNKTDAISFGDYLGQFTDYDMSKIGSLYWVAMDVAEEDDDASETYEDTMIYAGTVIELSYVLQAPTETLGFDYSVYDGSEAYPNTLKISFGGINYTFEKADENVTVAVTPFVEVEEEE